ncbi:hypothetical protein [uncultured Pseudokineococcus sp.]|uniref:hypothetical protein n=1 Tax=uncultured Pseudokineococcus sp. TaxID=1642928 RepID=UPI00260947D4|nr:hypothetical protein [uncultured Pseudokineococcus sp.]
MDAAGNAISSYAFIDLRGYRLGANPLLRALAEHLGVLTDPTDRRALDSDEYVEAYVRLGVRKILSSDPSGVAFDSGDALFSSPHGLQALVDLVDTSVLSWSSVVVASKFQPKPTGLVNYRPGVDIRALTAAEAAQVLIQHSAMSPQTIRESVELLDADARTPKVLISSASRLEASQDCYEVAELVTRTAVDHSLSHVGTLLSSEDLGRGDWAVSLVRTLEHGAPLDNAHAKMIGRAFSWLDAEDALRPTSRDMATRLVSLAMSSGRLDLESRQQVLAYLLGQAPRHLLEDLIADPWLDAQDAWHESARQQLIDRVARMTVTESLGSAIPARATFSYGITGRQSSATDILIAARTAINSSDLAARLELLIAQCSLWSDDESGLQVVSQALREAEARFAFDLQSVQVRRTLHEEIDFRPGTPIALALIGLELDSAQALAFSGDTRGALALLYEAESQLTVIQQQARAPQSEGWLQGRVIVLRARLHLMPEETGLRALESLQASERLAAADAVFAKATLLDIAASRGVDASTLKAGLQDLLRSAHAHADTPTRAAVVSRVVAAVRGVGVELPAIERRDLLEQAVTLARSVGEDARMLAAYGDARPVAATVRALLALSKELRRDPNASTRGRRVARELRLEAIDVLRASVASAPNATLWGLYLRAVDRLDASVYDPTSDATWLAARELTSADAVSREYRRWARGRRIASARELEVELWLLRRTWAKEGSMVGLASSEDPRWHTRTFTHKREVISGIYARRVARLAAMEGRWGWQVDIRLERFRVERQYQHFLGQHSGGIVDEETVLNVLQADVPDHSQPAGIRLAKASFLRQVGRTDEAIRELESIASLPLAHRDVTRRQRLLLAQCLIDKASREANQDVQALASRALRLIGNLEEASADAAMLALRARLELTGGQLPPIAEEVWGLFASSGPMNETWTQSELFALCEELLSEQDAPFGLRVVVRDFTNPRVLMKFSALLIRWHVLSRDRRIQRLEAALIAMDGARIFAASTSKTASLSWLQGRALLLGCENMQSRTPFAWGSRAFGVEVDDLELARRRLQSAKDRSVGNFRGVVSHMLDRVTRLDRSLPR